MTSYGYTVTPRWDWALRAQTFALCTRPGCNHLSKEVRQTPEPTCPLVLSHKGWPGEKHQGMEDRAPFPQYFAIALVLGKIPGHILTKQESISNQIPEEVCRKRFGAVLEKTERDNIQLHLTSGKHGQVLYLLSHMGRKAGTREGKWRPR